MRGALSHHQKIRLMGHAHELLPVLDHLPHLEVDVLLIDAHLTRGDSRSAIRQLRAVAPELKILPIGLESDQEILECLEAGACGYVPSEASLDDLVETLLAIAGGDGPHCSAQLASSVIDRIAELSHQLRQRPPRRLPEGLRFTPREQEILHLLMDGQRNKEIAQKLFIALPTVKIHVHKILKKMQVRNRREAVQLALESGFQNKMI